MHGYWQGKGVTGVAEARKEGWSHWSGDPTWSLNAGGLLCVRHYSKHLIHIF